MQKKMSAASRKLFKEMIAEAARMPDFNYRSYFLRFCWTNLLLNLKNIHPPTASPVTFELPDKPEILIIFFMSRRITHSFKEGEEFRNDEDIHK